MMTKNKNSKRQTESNDFSDSSVFSEERLNKIAQNAKHNKAIKLWDLILIMAEEKSYISILPIESHYHLLKVTSKIVQFVKLN